jgi:transposase-like protein
MTPRTKDRELAPEQAAVAAMVADAKARGLALTGPDGLLKLFTKSVLEVALEEEMTVHLGHERNRAPVERESVDICNGSRAKTSSPRPSARSRSRFRRTGRALSR